MVCETIFGLSFLHSFCIKNKQVGVFVHRWILYKFIQENANKFSHLDFSKHFDFSELHHNLMSA